MRTTNPAWSRFILLWVFVSISLAGCGQATRSHKILFLGNSVFYYQGGLYQSFEGFCEAAGLDYRALSQRTAPDNTHGIEFLDFGRIPTNLPAMAASAEIHELIREGRFDYVVLEARRTGYLMPAWVEVPERSSDLKIPYSENTAALQSIHRTIVESGAQTVLYMHPGHAGYPDLKHPEAQVYYRLHADLEKMEINGREHEVILVPASLLWLDALKRYSLGEWYADEMHGTPMARYASACMIYTFITGMDPRENPFMALPKSWDTPASGVLLQLKQEDAAWIKQQVWLYYSTRFP